MVKNAIYGTLKPFFLHFDASWHFPNKRCIERRYWTYKVKMWKKTSKSSLDWRPLTRKWNSYTSFPMFCLKNLKNSNFGRKNDRKYWIFDSGMYSNTNCFSWYFKLKTCCLLLYFYIRPFSGPCIGPRMQ
jgi:hypothetical protein